MGRAVLWNVSIRKAVAVIVPNMANGIYGTALGFGVCRETNDPKIVKIRYISGQSDMESITHIPWQVEVFTLSTGAWRSPYGSNLPRKSIIFCRLQVVVIDRFLYWHATDTITMDGGFRSYHLIISFDMTSEEFGEINFPDSLVHNQSGYTLSISKLRESLVVLEYSVEANVASVWIMGDGVLKSFTKLFTINVNAPNAFARGFRKSGEPIIEIVKCYHGWFHVTSLVVFEPYSKHINHLGISGFACPSCVYPYMETLLLLDQPDSVIYNKGERYISKRIEGF
ncbi:hypothetical protein L1987_65243 [Smallanthus sonchifolius]|uniref:Uncharacterized protein n=1 Tax=Smallanthus sonchifolius TaxID=185202 RepID=A0ACB9BU06_9ASTR|nr:hypothetical protein L1987_65243 [Smallanthus sonchifolius]